MKFRVTQCPKSSPVRLQDILTVRQVAELMEGNARDIATRARGASYILWQRHQFNVIPDEECDIPVEYWGKPFEHITTEHHINGESK